MISCKLISPPTLFGRENKIYRSHNCIWVFCLSALIDTTCQHTLICIRRHLWVPQLPIEVAIAWTGVSLVLVWEPELRLGKDRQELLPQPDPLLRHRQDRELLAGHRNWQSPRRVLSRRAARRPSPPPPSVGTPGEGRRAPARRATRLRLLITCHPRLRFRAAEGVGKVLIVEL